MDFGVGVTLEVRLPSTLIFYPVIRVRFGSSFEILKKFLEHPVLSQEIRFGCGR
jgi:hypothetical protein